MRPNACFQTWVGTHHCHHSFVYANHVFPREKIGHPSMFRMLHARLIQLTTVFRQCFVDETKGGNGKYSFFALWNYRKNVISQKGGRFYEWTWVNAWGQILATEKSYDAIMYSNSLSRVFSLSIVLVFFSGLQDDRVPFGCVIIFFAKGVGFGAFQPFENLPKDDFDGPLAVTSCLLRKLKKHVLWQGN